MGEICAATAVGVLGRATVEGREVFYSPLYKTTQAENLCKLVSDEDIDTDSYL